MQRIFIKICFLFMVGSVCRIKWFTTGFRNVLKDIQKLQMMPNHVTLLRLQQKQLCKDRQCSNYTWVFPWFSIQHNARSFEVLESMRTVSAQKTEGSRKKLTEWVCPCSISYSMQMEKISLTGSLLGKNHGSITTNLNQSVLQCNGNNPVHPQPRSSKLKVQLGRLCLACFGILTEHC
jgi:hypothetical protein